MRRLTVFVLASMATLAIAAAPDYAREWPVRVPATPAGAYTLELTPEVYATVQRADLRDLDVLDASGRPVPAEIVAAGARADLHRAALPWFRMPAPDGGAGSDWRVIADVDGDGRLRGLRSSAVDAARPVTTLLLDASALGQAPVALELAWRPVAPFDAGYRIEASDDFDTWQGVGRGRLVDIREGGRALQRRRLAIDAGTGRHRFLRLVPDDASAALPDIVGADALWTNAGAQAPHWRTLPPRAVDGGAFEFESASRAPVRWIDLDTAGNDARTWRLQSRDTADARWIDRASRWVVYRVGAGRSPMLEFSAPVRDRYWRLSSPEPGDAPSLRLGDVPERVVFIAAGRPPYTLVAGSAQAQRGDRPVRAALDDASRASPVATLGPSRTRAGDAALAPRRDWKTWGLWAVLGLGVLIVGAFALRVLREAPRDVD